MISLRPSRKDELVVFDEMDRQDHARKFVNQSGLDTHQKYYEDQAIIYLSIEDNLGEIAGYFILVLEPDTASLEFRRILIDRLKRGVGQAAIKEMEIYSRKEYRIKRIWLDVYEDNLIGRHIYEKMGYQQFKVELVEGRNLLFYEKFL